MILRGKGPQAKAQLKPRRQGLWITYPTHPNTPDHIKKDSTRVDREKAWRGELKRPTTQATWRPTKEPESTKIKWESDLLSGLEEGLSSKQSQLSLLVCFNLFIACLF